MGLPGVRLVGVVDPDRSQREMVTRVAGCAAFGTLEEMFKAGVDAVTIAAPTHLHHSIALECIGRGIHVLVEKPLTTARREADELIALAARQQRVLMVDHTFLYHPAVRKIKALIDAGDLGQLRYIDSTRINLGLFQHDVNVLWDLAVHDLSIVNYLTPERPVAVSAVATAHTAGAPENIGFIVLRYGSGMVVHLNCSWVSPVKIRHILIGGDRRMILYNDLDANEPVKVYDSGYQAHTDEERNRLLGERVFEDILLRQNITTHYLPMTAAGEKGIDVWLALETYELAVYKQFNVVVLIAGDGDFLPLVRKLNTLGTRVMLLAWDFQIGRAHV